MKIFKKIICLGIVAVMLLASLVSLASCNIGKINTNDTESDAADVTEDTQTKVETDQFGQEVYNDVTEGLNFNGRTINFLVRSGDQYIREWYVDEPANNLDQQIFARNTLVQSSLNVRLNYIPQSEGANCKDFYDKVYNTASSGLGGIDVVSHFAAYATGESVLPYYVNWLDSAKLPYISLNRTYWNQNYISDAEAFGKLYLCVGDMNLSLYDRCMVVFFNKAKVKDYIKDSSGEAINLYQLVQSGEWYYETFYGMIKDVYEDTGSVAGARDNTDFYGVTGIKGSEASDAFLYSLGGMLTATSAVDGSHALVTDSEYLKLSNIYSAMIDFWYSAGATMPSTSYINYDIFTGGHALFTVDVVWHYAEGLAKLQSMTDGYGIIPMPKYDENQDEYITGVQDAYNVLSIMDCSEGQDFEMISAVLEKMAFLSYSSVRPYYVENILMKRNMDYDSAACFDYVLNGIRWDFADVYCAGIGWVRNALWRSPFGANASFETNWESYGKKNDNLIRTFDTVLISMR